MAIAYSPTKEDLFFPARRGEFFAAGPPRSEAELCAELSRLAYCRREPDFYFDIDKVNEALSRIGFACQFSQTRNTPDGMGTHCLLASSPSVSVVSFRGTDSTDPLDLLDDAHFVQTRWSAGGRVHAGFARALADVSSQVLDALANCSGRVLFTGHSLGAALATLLASLRKPDALFTFGSPRVGDEDFVETIKNVVTRRFVDCCDAVTRVPPQVLPGIRYAHAGEFWYIAADRSIVCKPDEDFVRKDRARASAQYLVNYGWMKGNVELREFADHAPINYVTAIAAIDQQAASGKQQAGKAKSVTTESIGD